MRNIPRENGLLRDNRGITKDRIGPTGLGDGKTDPKRAMRRLEASTEARERKKTQV